jgi:hypothetical protein
VTELNPAVAVSMTHGPQQPWSRRRALRADLAGYDLYAATRADLQARLGLLTAEQRPGSDGPGAKKTRKNSSFATVGRRLRPRFLHRGAPR